MQKQTQPLATVGYESYLAELEVKSNQTLVAFVRALVAIYWTARPDQ